MVQLAQAFDVRSVKPSDPDGFGGFPVGGIPCQVTKTEIVENKDKDSGHQAILTLVGLDGPAKGSTATWRLNLYHMKSEKARSIAYEQLSALGHVTGVYNIVDLDQLIGKPFIAVVESRNDPQYPNSTEVKGCLDFNGDKPGQPGVKGRIPVAQAPVAPAAAGQPWTPAAAAGSPAAGPFGPASAPSPSPAGFAPAAPAAAPVAAPAAPAVAPGGWAAAAAPAAAPATGQAPAWATPSR